MIWKTFCYYHNRRFGYPKDEEVVLWLGEDDLPRFNIGDNCMGNLNYPECQKCREVATAEYVNYLIESAKRQDPLHQIE